MHLGNILRRQGGTALTGRRVRFRIVRRDSAQNCFIEEVEALLFPVSADREIDVLSAAVQACKRDLKLEYQVQVAARFLAASLRDPERPISAFVLDEDIDAFIRCMSVDELERLHREYKAYMADEYSPKDSPEERDGVRTEAIRFTSPGPASP